MRDRSNLKLEFGLLLAGIAVAGMFPALSAWIGIPLMGLAAWMIFEGANRDWRRLVPHVLLKSISDRISASYPRLAKWLEPALPLTIGQLREPSYSRNAGFDQVVSFSDEKGTRQGKYDCPLLEMGPVNISNNSLTRSLTLEIDLSITDKHSKTHRLNGDGKAQFALTLGVNDRVSQSFKKRGLEVRKLVLSPVSIPPQTTVSGHLTFLISVNNVENLDHDKISRDMLQYYVEGSAVGKPESRFKYALEIRDLISDTTISLPLPCDGYKRS